MIAIDIEINYLWRITFVKWIDRMPVHTLYTLETERDEWWSILKGKYPDLDLRGLINVTCYMRHGDEWLRL